MAGERKRRGPSRHPASAAPLGQACKASAAAAAQQALRTGKAGSAPQQGAAHVSGCKPMDCVPKRTKLRPAPASTSQQGPPLQQSVTQPAAGAPADQPPLLQTQHTCRSKPPRHEGPAQPHNRAATPHPRTPRTQHHSHTLRSPAPPRHSGSIKGRCGEPPRSRIKGRRISRPPPSCCPHLRRSPEGAGRRRPPRPLRPRRC